MGYMDQYTDLGTVSGSSSGSTGGGGMGFDIASALGGIAQEAASAWYANRTAEKRQHESFDQQKWMMQNRYQMQTGDLKAAGLNPMLATSQGAPMPSAPGPAPVTKIDAVNAMATARVSSAQSAKMQQETENLKVENNNLKNTSEILIKQLSKIDAEVEEIDQKIKTGKASEQEMIRRTELMDIQKELVRAQVNLSLQERRIKTPEEIASGAEGASQAATVSRILKPLIDLLGGVTGAARNMKGR